MTLQVISEGPAHEEGAERTVFHSDRMGRAFQVTVSRPSATPFAPEQTFPAIVALDNGYEVAGPMARLLAMGGAMAPAFVVSVWYPPGQEHHRNTDLLHEPWTPLYWPSFGGGGALFETFLLEDLLPFVVGRHPIERGRIALVGHSAGGLFAANILATRPDAFAAYVISSAPASLDLAERVELGVADAKSKRVYLAAGSHEDVFRLQRDETVYLTGFARLDAALRRAPGVECRSPIYSGEGHLSVLPRVIADAFPFVLPPPRPLTAPQPRLAAATGDCEGVYALADGRQVTISFEQGLLRAGVAGLAKAPLMHVQAGRYYCPMFDLGVDFDAGGLTLSGGAASWRGERMSAE
jgi:hypothetical protein